MKNLKTCFIAGLMILLMCTHGCSKKTTESSSSNCSNPVDCLANTWYCQQINADYGGSTVTIWAKGGTANLDNISNSYLIIRNDHTYLSYILGNLHDGGTWKMIGTSSFVTTNVTFADTLIIVNIGSGVMNTNQIYNHQYPSLPMVQLADGSGLDTAKLSSFSISYSFSP
jgi:hypothetical protein